ncbi:MAG: hypothetical protein Q8O52_10075 [Sulfuritalea sp.]|nr:hypothetical protein [Sulfuritalea sp.]
MLLLNSSAMDLAPVLWNRNACDADGDIRQARQALGQQAQGHALARSRIAMESFGYAFDEE